MIKKVKYRPFDTIPENVFCPEGRNNKDDIGKSTLRGLRSTAWKDVNNSGTDRQLSDFMIGQGTLMGSSQRTYPPGQTGKACLICPGQT